MISLWSTGRARRNAQRRLADLRRPLATAEQELSSVQNTVTRAERRFDLADRDVAEAEQAFEAARAERKQARRQRCTARQARDRPNTTVHRIKRQVRELSERLDRMPRKERCLRGGSRARGTVARLRRAAVDCVIEEWPMRSSIMSNAKPRILFTRAMPSSSSRPARSCSIRSTMSCAWASTAVEKKRTHGS